jgi:cell division protease FtsH
MEAKQTKFSVGYAIATLIAIFLLQSILFAPHAENLTYSEFKTLVKKGKVNDLVLDKKVITGTLAAEGLEGLLPKDKIDELKQYGSDAHRFVTARVDDPGLVGELEAANVKFTGRVENTWLSTLLSWVLPTLLFVGVWAFVMRRMAGPRVACSPSGRARPRCTSSTARA